ncbi:hypothetical protein PHJA_000395300 [Phtheirospermum japonicum]|uniref:DUF1985 domain-containing protein n=1 Tax=Phtheirospermum japonicum TaxID=374723 RepID=A0A830BDZ6_9LAMI|nr:hypothetical protein PHJA_000395300 [Phtheirospermum japonicum]
MRNIRLIPREEPCDEMEAATLHQASPEPEAATEGTAEEVKWTWKRKAPRRSKPKIKLYSKRSIAEQIAAELKLIGDGVYQELINSCFGFLMRFDTQGVVCHAALHYLFAHEVVKADAGPDELWYRVGGRFIRFSKYEYALVTGLSFGPTTFDPSAEHHPPVSGLYSRHYQGRNLTMDALRRGFIHGVFRGSPADALKVAKLLIVYFLLFGMDGRRTYIDEWAWTLIEDTDRWETFMWGKFTYQILLRYLQRIPTELPNSKASSYHVYGYVWAFLIWAFEAVPGLGITCGVRTSDDVLPRCLRWRFPETQVDMGGFSDRQMEVHSTLEPSAEEQRQPYWEHMIRDDLRSDVCYMHQDNTTPVNPSSGDVPPVCRPQGSEASPTRRSCSNSASPITRKRKRTDPQTTRASSEENTVQKELSLVRQELALVQQELPSVIRQEVHLALKEILLRRSSPEARDPTTVELYKMESDKAVELYKRRLENLSPKIMETEVGDLSNPVNDMHMLATSEGRNSDIPDFNGSTPDDAENVVVMSRKVRSTSNATGSRGSGLSKKDSLCQNIGKNYSERCPLDPSLSNEKTSLVQLSLGDRVEKYHAPPVLSFYRSHSLGSASFERESHILIVLTVTETLFSLGQERMMMHIQLKLPVVHNQVAILLVQSKIVNIESHGLQPLLFINLEMCTGDCGCALAEYLIDGDRELRLRKSVSEVKKERPDVIGQCRKLASVYVEKLFQIYCAADDPFFGQS